MECLPFVRRLTLIRTGSIPESPADFNKKAFARRSGRRAGNSLGSSTASTISLESSLESDGAHGLPDRGGDSLSQRALANSSGPSSGHHNDGDSDGAAAEVKGGPYERRRGVLPAYLLYNQVEESIDQSTVDYSISTELEVDIQLTDAEDFLGISIVGQNYSNGDSSLFVGTVIPGGAVSRDGRVEAGDLILSVNGISLEGKSNKQAVDILRQAVKLSRSVRLVVVPCDNMSVYSDGSCVRPIDPFLWLAHNSFMQQNDALRGRTPSSGRGGGARSLSSLASSSLSSSMPSTAATMRSRQRQKALPLETPIDIVANRLKSYAADSARPQSGASKSLSATALSGARLRDWLYYNIRGFKDLEEVNLYASNLFLAGYITPIRQILDRERTTADGFRLDENYVVQTRPLTPAVRPLTPSLMTAAVRL